MIVIAAKVSVRKILACVLAAGTVLTSSAAVSTAERTFFKAITSYYNLPLFYHSFVYLCTVIFISRQGF